MNKVLKWKILCFLFILGWNHSASSLELAWPCEKDMVNIDKAGQYVPVNFGEYNCFKLNVAAAEGNPIKITYEQNFSVLPNFISYVSQKDWPDNNDRYNCRLTGHLSLNPADDALSQTKTHDYGDPRKEGGTVSCEIHKLNPKNHIVYVVLQQYVLNNVPNDAVARLSFIIDDENNFSHFK